MQLDPDHVRGDMLGAAYEYLLREFAEASGKKAGEFFTPRHVVHLLVKLLDPKPGDKIIDRAIQVHGGGGVSDDFPLALWYANMRTLRLADGPDEVHKMTIARREYRRRSPQWGKDQG